jgi:hypothetical protein
LAGCVPYGGTTPFEIQNGHVNLPVPDPRIDNPGLPETLVKLLQRALAKDPLQRFSSAAEFTGRLKFVSQHIAQEKIQALVAEATQEIDQNNYTFAIERLQEAQAIQPDKENENLVELCHKRLAVLTELEEILQQEGEIQKQEEKLGGRRKAIFEAEKWLANVQSETMTQEKSVHPIPLVDLAENVTQEEPVEMIKSMASKQQKDHFGTIDWIFIIITLILSIFIIFVFAR